MKGGDTDKQDITFPTKDGVFNMRVGAIILRDDKVLMVKNNRDPYYYSVGGRVKLQETLEEAVIRECFEETKVHVEVDRLVFIHENFFPLQRGPFRETQFHEISFFYLMKSNEVEVICESYTSDGIDERLEWLPISNLQDAFLFPEFFKSETRLLAS
ncbi:NUDIX domain-containing protein [Lysinibacillus sp. Bpr_S20]|uniref:NUDIX hydrolase n=1 Tax=Lysinibacillus sp. Bpr_S20 TaxID=2933964 RepID=UPI002011147C|nr:NUDIX domain-containing protein [Lysinibacillus sp. Bpr_S20]MCL1701672.1 NUDIX domain-containing protein [Lysinibacillus sp. Bpr_S20]